MENRKTTSIQYQYTNVKLFREIFYNWKEFNAQLNKGPDAMKEYFLSQWAGLRDSLKNREDLVIRDLYRIVSKDDFDVTVNKTSKGTPVFYFTFPDYDFRDGASKYVALSLGAPMPRFITLEYSEHQANKELCWVVGEFAIDRQTNSVKHNNYGTVDNNRLSAFAGYVMGILEAQGV